MSTIEKFVDRLDDFSQDRLNEIQKKHGSGTADVVAKELERMKLEVVKQIKCLIAEE